MIECSTSAVTDLVSGASYQAIDTVAPPGLIEPAASEIEEPAVPAAKTDRMAPVADTGLKPARPFAVLEAPPPLAMVAADASSALTESVAMALPSDF